LEVDLVEVVLVVDFDLGFLEVDLDLAVDLVEVIDLEDFGQLLESLKLLIKQLI
jgi:hypothetical protein